MGRIANIIRRAARTIRAIVSPPPRWTPARVAAQSHPSEDLTWDGAGTNITITIGVRRVPFQSVTLPEAGADGPGHVVGVMLLTDYATHVLPWMPKSGGPPPFAMVVTIKHPSIPGRYQMLLDGCAILTTAGPHVGTESALTKTITIHAGRAFERYDGDVWKTLAPVVTAKPRAEAPDGQPNAEPN